jgi:glutathione S-transferase
VRPAERLGYVRHKERKFGPGCLEQWRRGRAGLLRELALVLLPFDQMLRGRPFLLENRPRFLDFDLWGMLANLLYTGHYTLPKAYPRLRQWYRRLSTLRSSDLPSEKLHS